MAGVYSKEVADATFARLASPVNARTGTSYTFVEDDATRLTTQSNVSASAITVPPSVFSSGDLIPFANRGAGLATLTAGVGVSFFFNGASVSAVPVPQYQSAQIEALGSNAFVVTTSTTYETICISISDEVTALSTGTGKATFVFPWAFTLETIQGGLGTASSSGLPTVDMNLTGTGTVLSTKLTIDANELTSLTAATQPVISTVHYPAGSQVTFDQDVAGTGAKGMKVYLLGYRG